jgi:hypothetical protein
MTERCAASNREMRSQVWISTLSALLAWQLLGCSSSDKAGVETGVEYVAVGDSIAYGDNGFIDHTAVARPDPSVFVGYPDLVGKEVYDGHYVNLGCPGATTGSFSSLDETDNGCRAIQTDDPSILHVSYTTTQADEADTYLSMSDVKLITVSLGGNDLLLTLAACTAKTPDDPTTALNCAIANLPATLSAGATNLAALLQHFKDQGFKGQLLYVNLYSTYTAGDSATLAVSLWNSKMKTVVTDAGGTVADAFTAFTNAAKASDGDPCAAGLLIPNPVAGDMPACDAHPSDMGKRLLADTVKAAISP